MPATKKQKSNIIATASLSALETVSARRITEEAYTSSESVYTPSNSAATRLISGRNNKAYLCHLGLRVQAFEILYKEFVLHYPQKCQTECPRILDAKMVLALVLIWLHSEMEQEVLGLIFGAPAAVINRSKDLGIQTLLTVFQSKPNDPRWEIAWPSSNKKAEFNEMVLSKTAIDFERGVLAGVFGFVDSLSLKIEHPVDPLEHNAYYIKCKRDCFTSQIIAFTPDGCICYVRFNCPGTWDDSEIAEPLYENLLSSKCHEPFKVISDSSFPCKRKFASKVLSTSKRNAVGVNLQDRETKRKHAVIKKNIPAVRWGMKSLQKWFGRLNLKLSANKQERHDSLSVVWRLHNFRIRVDGNNQIRTAYHGAWNYGENALETSE
ncbi:hypothetical protein INT47_007268 [Mucor saturninus]|uniref:DDE Tnp4 domain-containing protein n=1 Tax=Mucor saturninus TaxID=64648 RepID=A0A8H7V3W7_9FUNG|nr:hypothetical protein INT47_007268 [Mucor saturninus]